MALRAEPTTPELSAAELTTLLARTSRTFALTIPLLTEPRATQVGIAYLLFRIADTLEDAPRWGRDTRHAALVSFARWLEGPREESAAGSRHEGAEVTSAPAAETWSDLALASPPSADDGCIALLARADAVLGALGPMTSNVRRTITHHVARTTRKMAEFVARQGEGGSLALTDLADLKAYCYAVAGIVGEMLTELFVLGAPELEDARDRLMALAPAFGEGLQLVNILKDAPSDAHEGRIYVPGAVAPNVVVALAREDLARACDYVRALAEAGAPADIRAFCALPVRLAEATLDRLGEGAAKLTRDEVLSIYSEVRRPLNA